MKLKPERKAASKAAACAGVVMITKRSKLVHRGGMPRLHALSVRLSVGAPCFGRDVPFHIEAFRELVH